MADDNPTLQDIFRVVNDMRADQNDFRKDVTTRFADVTMRLDRLESGQEVLSKKADAHSRELQVVREVIDTLPSEDDFQELDRKIAVVANDAKATRTDVRNLKADVSRLRADVKTAGVPVR